MKAFLFKYISCLFSLFSVANEKKPDFTIFEWTVFGENEKLFRVEFPYSSSIVYAKPREHWREKKQGIYQREGKQCVAKKNNE